jgi:hypothetical protein
MIAFTIAAWASFRLACFFPVYRQNGQQYLAA